MHRSLLAPLFALALVLGPAASQAPAWTTNGPLAFTATTGALRLSFTPGIVLNCSAPNSVVGGLQAKSGAPSGIGLADVEPRFSPCSVMGLWFTVTCTALASTSPLPAALNGTNYDNTAGTTTGTISNNRCIVTIPNCSVTITGSMAMAYKNTTWQMTLPASSQYLTYVAVGSACPALGFAPSGSFDVVNASGSSAVYTVTSLPKPAITNP